MGKLRLRGNGSTPELGPDVANLTLTVENISPFILRTKIGAPGRWEVPRSLFNAPNLTGAAAMDSVHLQVLASLFSGTLPCLTVSPGRRLLTHELHLQHLAARPATRSTTAHRHSVLRSPAAAATRTLCSIRLARAWCSRCGAGWPPGTYIETPVIGEEPDCFVKQRRRIERSAQLSATM